MEENTTPEGVEEAVAPATDEAAPEAPATDEAAA